MAEIQLEKFKSQLLDGARPNRFWVTIDGPQAGASWDEPLSFFVKTFSLPARTVGEIVLNFQGMQTKIAGDPTYDDLTMTLHNDYGLKAKQYFEDWIEGFITVGQDGENTRLDPAGYKSDITVQQLGRAGEVLRAYKIVGAYPKQMDAIELSHESTDTFSELNISFGVDYFQPL